MAPQARLEAGGFLPWLPESTEQLDLLVLTVPKARRVHQDGIHFQGRRYLDLTLAAYVAAGTRPARFARSTTPKVPTIGSPR